ncbi:MAG: RNA methyltransferase [Elusimicrobiota bacterium]
MSVKVKFILNAPRNPKNIGASARGMANFGFRDLAVVNPYSVAWRETRSAVQAGPVVEKAKKYDSLKEALRRSHVVIGTSAGTRRNKSGRWIGLEELKQIIHESGGAKKSVAILFGSERSGLSNDDLAYCHYVLKIPTVRDCPSMNLSQAVAVVACAIRFEKSVLVSKVAQVETPVSVQHLEVLVEKARKAFDAAHLQRNWDPRHAKDRMRKSFYRWGLTENDIAMLHGIFGWVIKASKSGSKV